MYGDFPNHRPPGLRRRSLPAGTELWRLDEHAPASWSWAGFPTPRHRFDPASGAFRVRYAGWSVAGAARERYLDNGRYVPTDHAGHHLVRLVTKRRFRVLDLRTEANLDGLDIDDRISTSHEPAVWAACHRLSDAICGWWDDLDGIVYRSRTTPASSTNLAFFSLDGLRPTSRPLKRCVDELAELVLEHQFTLGFSL